MYSPQSLFAAMLILVNIVQMALLINAYVKIARSEDYKSLSEQICVTDGEYVCKELHIADAGKFQVQTTPVYTMAIESSGMTLNTPDGYSDFETLTCNTAILKNALYLNTIETARVVGDVSGLTFNISSKTGNSAMQLSSQQLATNGSLNLSTPNFTCDTVSTKNIKFDFTMKNISIEKGPMKIQYDSVRDSWKYNPKVDKDNVLLNAITGRPVSGTVLLALQIKGNNITSQRGWASDKTNVSVKISGPFTSIVHNLFASLTYKAFEDFVPVVSGITVKGRNYTLKEIGDNIIDIASYNNQKFFDDSGVESPNTCLIVTLVKT